MEHMDLRSAAGRTVVVGNCWQKWTQVVQKENHISTGVRQTPGNWFRRSVTLKRRKESRDLTEGWNQGGVRQSPQRENHHRQVQLPITPKYLYRQSHQKASLGFGHLQAARNSEHQLGWLLFPESQEHDQKTD